MFKKFKSKTTNRLYEIQKWIEKIVSIVNIVTFAFIGYRILSNFGLMLNFGSV